MPILERLREETRSAHIDLEKISGADKIIDHSINLDQYIKLLRSNYIAYAKAESRLLPLQNESIASWIQQDLQSINAHLPQIETKESEKLGVPTQLGIKYVIEGSLLGGAMIAQHITKCPALAHLAKQNFYASATPERAMRWRDFVGIMKSKDFTGQESQEIIDAANQTFELFKQAFLKEGTI